MAFQFPIIWSYHNLSNASPFVGLLSGFRMFSNSNKKIACKLSPWLISEPCVEKEFSLCRRLAMMTGFCSSKNLTTMDIKSNFKLFVLLGFKTTSPAPTQWHKRLCVRGLWEDQGEPLS